MKTLLTTFIYFFLFSTSHAAIKTEFVDIETAFLNFIMYEEEELHIFKVDFNLDGNDDYFLASSMQIGGKGIIPWHLYLFDNGKYKDVGIIAFRHPARDIFFSPEIGARVIKHAEGVGGIITVRISYLKEKVIVNELLSKQCSERAGTRCFERNDLGLFNDYSFTADDVLKNIRSANYTKEKAVDFIKSKENSGKLVSKQKDAIFRWKLRSMRSKSKRLYRVFDRESKEFLGYMDKSWDNKIKDFKDVFVSLKFNVDGSFEVYEEFGKEPHLRLKTKPNESPGIIVGAPIVEEKTEVKIIKPAEVSEPKVVNNELPTIADDK